MNLTLKIVFSLVIIFCGGYLGMIASSALSIRINQIEELSIAINQIGFNIGFLKMPVFEAISSVAKSRHGAVARFLGNISEEMSEFGFSPADAFEKAIEKSAGELCISENDTLILREFAENLGKGGVEYEMNNINAVSAKLKIAKDEAEGEKNQKYKLWRGAGILIGIFIVIMLF